MCYYISKLHHCEILRMKCEFVQDDNGSIWFSYASDIHVRANNAAKLAIESQMQTIKNQTMKKKKSVLQNMESNLEN